MEALDLTMYARIREEGLKHSHVMQFAGALTEGIGPQLTGSPNMAKASAWTRDTLTTIGLSNAHLEDWGEFGMGWQQINTWARMVSPDPEPLWAEASPWSSATKGPVTGEVVYVNVQDEEDLAAYKGKLGGKIVLLGAMRPTPDVTEPLFKRYTDTDLKEMETFETAGGPYTPGSPDLLKALADRARLTALRKAAPEDDGRGRGSGDPDSQPRQQWRRRHGNHLRRERGRAGPRCAEEGERSHKSPTPS